MTRPVSLVIVGNRGGSHVGESCYRAALESNYDVSFADALEASRGPALLRRAVWRLAGRRPLRIDAFGREVVALCRTRRPRVLITTGAAPLLGEHLSELRRMGVICLNYSTDDPWNPAHCARWFLTACTQYDHVFSTRTSNIADFQRLGCSVSFLPFGYDPELCYVAADSERRGEDDVLFAGGADADRIPYISALVKANLKVALYGTYWERYLEVSAVARGHLHIRELPNAVMRSKLTLGLVRRANRDGHAMRSYEIPAMQGCLLAEDTEEHRELFGEEGECVLYFRALEDMIEKATWLVRHCPERKRLAKAAHERIVTGAHTYRDRLRSMLGWAGVTL